MNKGHPKITVKSEEDLKANAVFSELFFAGASIGLNLCAMDGTWLLSNPAFLSIIGYTELEANGGLTYWQLTPRKYDTQEKEQIKSLLSQGRYGPYEKEFIRKDGTLIPVRLNGFLVESDGKKFIWSIIEDLSKIKMLQDEVEQHQKQIEKQYKLTQTVLENIPVAVFAKDVKNDFQMKVWNKTAEQIFGINRHQIVGKTDFEVFPQEQAEFFRTTDIKTMSDKQRVDIKEELARTKNGDVWLRTTKVGIYSDSGEPETLLGITEDISLKRDEEQRQLERNELLEAIPDFVVYFDLDGRALFINSVAKEILAWRLFDVEEKPSMANCFSPALISKIFPFVEKSRGVWEGEIEVCDWRSQQLIPVWQKVFPLKDIDGNLKGFAMIARDLRARKEAEAAMLHASRMASLGEMAGGVAHEINNPLTIMIGKTSQIKKKVQENRASHEELMASLVKIEDTGYRIAKIIKGLRTFSRDAEDDPFEVADLSVMISDILELCKERFQNHNVEVKVQEISSISLYCKPTQLQQVFLNLLNNSYDAIETLSEKWIEIKVVEFQGQVKITFVDSGSGIPSAISNRIMQPFFTTKESNRGTGLGLSISKGIIEKHGGHLSLDSKAANTSFVVELPLAIIGQQVIAG